MMNFKNSKQLCNPLNILVLLLLLLALQPVAHAQDINDQNTNTLEIKAMEIKEPREPIGPRQNQAPIILLHGFTGWGRDEALGFNYFGGLTDVESHMRKQGYQTFTTASGPFSSSWDRACEIYAQIKGGIVDYGEAHARNHGHLRYGRSYEGFYPQWGDINSTSGQSNKIHLVGHSQGGLDSRILTQLLSKGFEEEINTSEANNISPLFTGGHDWVLSLSSFSTPHDGTTLASQAFKLLPKHQYVLSYVSSLWSGWGLPLYDWKLQQWGLERRPEESYSDFQQRVEKSRFWRTTRDSASWILSPEGARETNRWVKAQPNVFYFSYSTLQTDKSWFSDEHKPDMGMNLLFRPLAHWMGEYTQDSPNRVLIDKTWFPNDGIVNTISMDGPKNGSTDTIVEYQGEPLTGVWNHMGVLKDMDHFDYLGMFNHDISDPRPFFGKLAKYLGALPE